MSEGIDDDRRRLLSAAAVGMKRRKVSIIVSLPPISAGNLVTAADGQQSRRARLFDPRWPIARAWQPTN